MSKGAADLEHFRRARKSPSRHENWNDSYFYGKDRNIKPEVQKWISLLTQDALSSSPTAILIQLCVTALKKDPQERPKTSNICEGLSFISLKTHFYATCDAFDRHLVPLKDSEDHQGVSGRMTLWFDRERLIAFGRALGTQRRQALSGHIYGSSKLYDDACEIIANLHHTLSSEDDRDKARRLTGPADTPKNSSGIPGEVASQFTHLVGALWGLLTLAATKEAEMAWLRSTLKTEDFGYLNNFGDCLNVSDDPLYEIGAATAAMKRLRPEMLSNPDSIPEDSILSASDIQAQGLVQGHSVGLYKRSSKVLIQWMYYNLAWDKVSPERTVIMGLRAQCFGVKPKSQGLRILNCKGVFESTGETIGYGFVYQIPPPVSGLRGSSTAMHLLLQILEGSHANPRQPQLRPLLEDKFRLSALLANFLVEFHSIEWLHENINSHNVLFLGELANSSFGTHLSSELLERPYIGGLQKSRPGGKALHSDGPSSGAVSQDYQHPTTLRREDSR